MSIGLKITQAQIIKFLRLTGQLDNATSIRKKEEEEEFMEGIRKILEDLLETYGSIEKAAEVWKKEDQENLNQLQNYWNVEL